MAQKLTLPALLFLLLAVSPVALGGWHWLEPAARRNQKGIEAFRRGEFAAALEQFLSARGLKGGAEPLKNNTAAALFQLKKYQEAVDEFSRVDPAKLGARQADFHYNLGNARFRLEQYPQALESYKRCLQLDPGDVQAKKNFELTLRKIREQQQEPRQEPSAESEKQKQKYDALMRFLDENEKKQLEKRKRKASPARNEKDW